MNGEEARYFWREVHDWLAGYLADAHQIYLNGVILVSMTGLNVETGPDVGYATFLPQLTATAWYHKKLPEDLLAKPLRAKAVARTSGSISIGFGILLAASSSR